MCHKGWASQRGTAKPPSSHTAATREASCQTGACSGDRLHTAEVVTGLGLELEQGGFACVHSQEFTEQQSGEE